MDSASNRKKAVAYKTVDIFSGITGKKLILKETSGGYPYTDGKEIGISFSSPTYYQDLEHEIAHILFRSDPVAKALFVKEYTERIAKILEKQGSPLDETKIALLRHGVDRLIGITEDHRVNSLWGLLYSGSYEIIRNQDRSATEPLVAKAHENGVCQMYLAVEAGWDPGPGKLERFLPYMHEALDKVERRGFEASLMVSKWLLANMVSELIREAKGEDTPKKPKPGAGQGAGQGGGGEGENKASDGDNLWTPPKVDASPQERADALNQLIDLLGTLPNQTAAKVGDVREPELKERGAAKAATKMVAEALKLDIHNDKDVAQCLGQTAKDMESVIEQAAEKLKGKSGGLSVDGWLRKDMGAKVVFLDVRDGDIDKEVTPFLPEDMAAVKRLRAVFNRVMGRRRFVLEDYGVEVDIGAYIERRVTNHPIPPYKQDSRGRGFQALVLVDRSSSMRGRKKIQSERACRILSRALKYPFVDLHIWGWNSQEQGQISIARFDPKLEVFDSPKSRVSGTTPLHLAVRVGSRFMEMGSEAKYMIVTTDGAPVFTSQDRQWYSNEFLYTLTKTEVKKARSKGINVTGVIIGNEIPEKNMTYMFGQKHWRRLNEDRLGPDLVRLVATSFMDFLKRG